MVYEWPPILSWAYIGEYYSAGKVVVMKVPDGGTNQEDRGENIRVVVQLSVEMGMAENLSEEIHTRGERGWVRSEMGKRSSLAVWLGV